MAVAVEFCYCKSRNVPKHGNGTLQTSPPAPLVRRCPGSSGLVDSASDCVRPRIESHCGRMCLSRRSLRYAALGTGCAHLYCSACRSTQLCLSPRSSTSFGWGKGWNVTSAGWQVTPCDPIRRVSSRSGEPGSRTAAICVYLTSLSSRTLRNQYNAAAAL